MLLTPRMFRLHGLWAFSSMLLCRLQLVQAEYPSLYLPKANRLIFWLLCVGLPGFACSSCFCCPRVKRKFKGQQEGPAYDKPT